MIDIKLYRVYSSISLSNYDVASASFELLKTWAENISKYWNEKLSGNAKKSASKLRSYICSFMRWFENLLAKRIDNLDEAKIYIDNLQMNFPAISNEELVKRSIQTYDRAKHGQEPVDLMNWSIYRLFGVVEAHIRHRHTKYDSWLKGMTKGVRNEGAYDYLKQRVRDEVLKQYPGIMQYLEKRKEQAIAENKVTQIPTTSGRIQKKLSYPRPSGKIRKVA